MFEVIWKVDAAAVSIGSKPSGSTGIAIVMTLFFSSTVAVSFPPLAKSDKETRKTNKQNSVFFIIFTF